MPQTDSMVQGLGTVIYHVADLSAAKSWYTKAFRQEPYFDQPFYVGFNIGGYELGLDPNQTLTSAGRGGSVAYWRVNEIDRAVDHFVASGSMVVAPVQDVGEGIKVRGCELAESSWRLRAFRIGLLDSQGKDRTMQRLVSMLILCASTTVTPRLASAGLLPPDGQLAETAHFDITFTDAAAGDVERVADVAEGADDRIRSRLMHELSLRPLVVVFSTAADRMRAIESGTIPGDREHLLWALDTPASAVDGSSSTR